MIEVKENLSFSDALTFLKSGKKVARKGWKNKEMFLSLVRENDKNTNYIEMKTEQETIKRDCFPDLLAEDWFVVEPMNEWEVTFDFPKEVQNDT